MALGGTGGVPEATGLFGAEDQGSFEEVELWGQNEGLPSVQGAGQDPGALRSGRPGALAQRPLPPQSHGEELRFVENGCHDNPTLDVASDSQSEMQEKQPSLNGGGAVNGPGGWSALMGGKRDPEDSDVFEEDTHL